MSKNKNQNKNQTSYEEQNRQLVDALYEQKLVKPTCSDCDDYFWCDGFHLGKTRIRAGIFRARTSQMRRENEEKP